MGLGARAAAAQSRGGGEERASRHLSQGSWGLTWTEDTRCSSGVGEPATMASQTSGRAPRLELGPPAPRVRGQLTAHSHCSKVGFMSRGLQGLERGESEWGGPRLSPMHRAPQLWLCAHLLISTSPSVSRVLTAQRGCPGLKESRNLDGWLLKKMYSVGAA